jgi:protein tyrosine/serine phosphatase
MMQSLNDKSFTPHELLHANFREIRCGAIAANTLYRSSHPVPDAKFEERVIAFAAREAQIATIINLSDTDAKARQISACAPWYERLYKQGSVIALGLTFSFRSDTFGRKLKTGLQFMLTHEAPYLIHCYAGIDRTGFIAALLEALLGASLQDIAADNSRSFIFSNGEAASSYNYMHNMFVELKGGNFAENELPQIAKK